VTERDNGAREENKKRPEKDEPGKEPTRQLSGNLLSTKKGKTGNLEGGSHCTVAKPKRMRGETHRTPERGVCTEG